MFREASLPLEEDCKVDDIPGHQEEKPGVATGLGNRSLHKSPSKLLRFLGRIQSRNSTF